MGITPRPQPIIDLAAQDLLVANLTHVYYPLTAIANRQRP
jgi:hypothetical protein